MFRFKFRKIRQPIVKVVCSFVKRFSKLNAQRDGLLVVLESSRRRSFNRVIFTRFEICLEIVSAVVTLKMFN